MERPYGTWPSPLSAARVAAQSVRLMAVSLDADRICWLERRPAEGGRTVLVARDPQGSRELTPRDINVRTRVHEYGGGAHLVAGDVIAVSNFDDQRIYRIDPSGGAAVPLTPPGRWHYADATLDARRRRLLVVREDHAPGDREAETTVVAVPLDGAPHPGRILVSGADFYAAPRISPDGARLAWLSWQHPQMPWDGTELWVADIGPDGDLRHAVCVAGGPDESIVQPGWTPAGDLLFVSDRTGWWQLYRCRLQGDGQAVEPVVRHPPPAAEFAEPQWLLGTSTWACAGDSRLAVAYTAGGRWRLAVVDLASGTLRDLATPWEPAGWVAATPTHAVLVAGSAGTAQAIVRIDLERGTDEVLRTASDDRLAPAFIAHPQAITCAGLDGGAVHAFYYAPTHPDCEAPPGARPPLIVVAHGGPTGAASATFDPRIQFWTSRGFAVADVNYRGSSGYGRAYRQALEGQWGVLDVGDLIAVARHLVDMGRADASRLIIRGGSAGGYTALAALAFHPGVFAAAASYYGVSDLEVLARDTHKFESRYLDRLVGPWPAARDLYRARSPIHAADRIACRLILFQGLEDRVVPPNQSEMMAAAVRANGWPVAYLAFEGEQHGFRRAETIVRCLEAELYFYGAVLGFSPADSLPPVPIQEL